MLPEEFEIILLGIIVVVQVYLVYNTLSRVDVLETSFNDVENIKVVGGKVPEYYFKENGEKEIVEALIDSNDKVFPPGVKIMDLTILSSASTHPVDEEVIKSINSYLLKNRGAIADFHLLKDVVDRNIDAIDEEINHAIPAPLYLGLAATMLGIIIGLIRVPGFDNNNLDLDKVLMPLLDGVKYAMVVSVLGLLMTTWLSVWVYKKARNRAVFNKNKFLSLLQANLLPELFRTETSGISALNDRLKNFSKQLTPIITDLSAISDKSLQVAAMQQETIRKIDNIDVVKLAKANTSIFKELSGMMESFQQFAQYYNELNQSMLHTKELTVNLKEFVVRTNHIETIAKGVGSTVDQNNKLSEYLAGHLIDVESREAALKNVVDTANRSITESLESLKDAVRQKIVDVQQVSVQMEPKLKAVYESSLTAFERMAQEQIHLMTTAYEKSQPQLGRLDKLVEIEKGINTLVTQDTDKQKQLIDVLGQLTKALQNSDRGNSSGTNHEIIAELQSIREVLKVTSAIQPVKPSKKSKALKAAMVTMNILTTLGLGLYIAYELLVSSISLF